MAEIPVAASEMWQMSEKAELPENGGEHALYLKYAGDSGISLLNIEFCK